VLLLGPELTLSIGREFAPGFRYPQYLVTLRLVPRRARQRVAFFGLPSVFFNLAHGARN
jgi:hypothetical protein